MGPAGQPGAPADSTAEAARSAVIPVSLLVSSARLILERHLGLVWVSGEISNFTRAASGHCYFNLKDGGAQVRCVFFRHKAQFAGFALKDGLSVEVRATASIYEARGEFQLNVETVRLAGIGALYERFERLKARLAAAGWFAEERKRPLPAFPRAIGIVTSPRAAALRDILTTVKRRWPSMPMILYATAVQGEGAADEIAAAIDAANARAEVDVLIVARGGGSIEDLWAFNEEVVARAVYASGIPVVSGVGHETDFTICDFVADARAPTPTGAATLASPDRVSMLAGLAGIASRLRRAGLAALEARIQRVDGLARRLVHPAARLREQRRDAAGLAGRLSRAWRNRFAIAGQRFAHTRGRLTWLLRQPLAQKTRPAILGDAMRRAGAARAERLGARVAALEQSLAHLNPQRVLERGYAIVTTAEGTVVDDASRLAVGDEVALAFARGGADAKITRRDAG
jgi:exodeoxyribonuclease VII large subunit